MAKYTIEDTTLTNIASAIREKTGKSELLLPSQMPSEIQSISGGGEDFSITEASYLFIMGDRLESEDELIGKLDKPTTLFGMYAGAKKETIDFSNIDLSECTTLERCFASYSNYTGNMQSDKTLRNIIIGQNIPKLANLNSTFSYRWTLTNLDLSSINIPDNLVSCSSCFQGTRLIGNASFPTIKVSNASSMFSNFSIYTDDTLETLGNIDISSMEFSQVTNFNSMFSSSSINSIINSNFDMSSSTNNSNMFKNVRQLVNLCVLNNLGKGFTQHISNYSNYRLSLNTCVNLTHDSLMNVINGLYDLNLTYDVANGGTLYTQSLALGETNLAKLTETEIAIATNKGWVVS